jgi:hypothetical protein
MGNRQKRKHAQGAPDRATIKALNQEMLKAAVLGDVDKMESLRAKGAEATREALMAAARAGQSVAAATLTEWDAPGADDACAAAELAGHMETSIDIAVKKAGL